jgi:hypothetical protein
LIDDSYTHVLGGIGQQTGRVHAIWLALSRRGRAKAEVRSADRLANHSWRIFWLTMINRYAPDAPSQVALTQAEVELLDKVVKDTA